MKMIFLNTQLTQKEAIYQEIKELFSVYDHVKVENKALKMTWNFYKSQQEEQKNKNSQKKQIDKSKPVKKQPVGLTKELEQKKKASEKPKEIVEKNIDNE